MSEDRLITLAIHTYDKAVMLKSLLENEGVSVVLHNVNLLHPVISSGVRVRIKEKDLPLALRIVENIDIFSNNDLSLKNTLQIIVPTDFSQHSLLATIFAFNLAKENNSAITFLHSFIDPNLSGSLQLSHSKNYDENSDSREQILQEAKNHMEKFCRDIKQKIKTGEIPPVKFSTEIKEGVPEDVISAFAKQLRPNAIVMGTRGAGKKGKELIGSVTAEVLDSCRFPVFSIPEVSPLTSLDSIRNISFLCNLDQDDILAIDALSRLLTNCKLNITLVHLNDKKHSNLNDSAINGLLNYCTTHYTQYHFAIQSLKPTNILDDFNKFESQNKFDLIAIPNKKKNILARLFNPSIAHRILFNADIPMMVIPV